MTKKLFQYKSVAQPDKTINETVAADWIGRPDEPLKGFSWKSSTKRETTGIIFWSDVFLYDAPNGEKIAIYLMDTQGLFDHSSSPTDNIRIFSLSALVSSVQLMNIFNMIEESHLEYLQVTWSYKVDASLLKFITFSSQQKLHVSLLLKPKPNQNLFKSWCSSFVIGFHQKNTITVLKVEINSFEAFWRSEISTRRS